MCGMRRKEDIAYANEVKPDAIGYIFFSKSKRYVTGQQARELDQNLDQKILSVGVFVNETIEKVTEIANEVPLDVIQLHGDEDVIYIEQLRQQTDKEIWKAVRVKDTKDIKEAQQLPVDKLLLDTFTEGKDMYGGTGKVMNYDLIPKEGIRKPFFIAGGLHSKNIKEITERLEKVRPHGIVLFGCHLVTTVNSPSVEAPAVRMGRQHTSHRTLASTRSPILPMVR